MNLISEGIHKGIADFEFKMYRNGELSPIGSGNQLLLGLFEDCMYSQVILMNETNESCLMHGIIRNDYDERYSVELIFSKKTNRYDVKIEK